MTLQHEHLLLIGGGHAHVAVLADWIKHGLPCVRATLLTPSTHLRYSGMVPGWITGQYDRDHGVVDLAALAHRAGVKLVLNKCAEIDPEARLIGTQDGKSIAFDIASIDTGGIGMAAQVLGEDRRLLDIRPIDGFVEKLAQLPSAAKIAVVGGGAGGAELAFALRNFADRSALPEIAFVTGSAGLLPEFSDAVRGLVAKELARQGITVIADNAQLKAGELVAGGRSLEPLDLIVAAIGSAAPQWPKAGGLDCDADGFIAVDRHQRSVSHPHVFAVGDVAARQDRRIPHSGVHAVYAGPKLAINLRTALAGDGAGAGAWASYEPRGQNLYLMSTGDGSAIASYGPFSAQGRWAARLKHWIDNRWISKYRVLTSGR